MHMVLPSKGNKNLHLVSDGDACNDSTLYHEIVSLK